MSLYLLTYSLGNPEQNDDVVRSSLKKFGPTSSLNLYNNTWLIFTGDKHEHYIKNEIFSTFLGDDSYFITRISEEAVYSLPFDKREWVDSLTSISRKQRSTAS